MVLYFSGTGNSAYVAKRIAKGTGDQAADLFETLRTRDHSPLRAQRPWVLVVPTYAWRIPRIVESWLEATAFTGNQDVYFVMTCGGSIGNAGAYLERLCAKKGLGYLGCLGITMPENYIALFSTPDREEASRIIAQAEPRIDQAIACIQTGQPLPQAAISLSDRVNSGIVNDLFYPLFVHARKFYATGGCVSCGKCAGVCPLGNISIQGGKPVWGSACTHCMACISHCPTEAIEYGTHSRGLPRYVCRKEAP